MKLGGLDISTVKLGASQVQAIYQGENLVWQNAPVATAATGVGQTSFTANWEAYTGAIYYLLDVSESSDFSTFVYENQRINAPNTSYVVVGLNSNTTYYYRVRASDEYEIEYQAILDYATTQGYTIPSVAQRLIQEKLLIDLKTAGIWSKLDTFAVFATDGDADFALIDWIRLTQYTAVNSPTFTNNVGFTGDATSAYLNTNFTPLIDANNYTLSNASQMFYRQNNANAITFIMGNIDNNRGNSLREDSSNRIWFNSNRSNTVADGTGAGFFMVTKTTDAIATHYKGTSTTTLSLPSPYGLGTGAVCALATSSSSGFSNSTLQFISLGADLNSEASDFKNALDTYITSL